MSDVIDPGKGARRQARKQAELLRRQKQREQLESAKAESELSAKKALAFDPAKGRRSLISPAKPKEQKRQRLG